MVFCPTVATGIPSAFSYVQTRIDLHDMLVLPADIRARMAGLKEESSGIDLRVGFALPNVSSQGSSSSLPAPGDRSIASELKPDVARMAGAGRTAASVAIQVTVLGTLLLPGRLQCALDYGCVRVEEPLPGMQMLDGMCASRSGPTTFIAKTKEKS